LGLAAARMITSFFSRRPDGEAAGPATIGAPAKRPVDATKPAETPETHEGKIGGAPFRNFPPAVVQARPTPLPLSRSRSSHRGRRVSFLQVAASACAKILWRTTRRRSPPPRCR
jgi:hypothetical protein